MPASSSRTTTFFDIAKSYPFGINKLGTEKIVRDPIKVGDDEELICVGEVPQEAYVHILTGDATSLVSAAQHALTLSEASLTTAAEQRTTLFIDCISRVLFLEDEFDRELQAVSRAGVPLIGALTLGEIANSRKDYLEFYNKTSVVGVLQG
ncbi:FIST C-terminal domain-containing protein [Planctomycetota bacterium]